MSQLLLLHKTYWQTKCSIYQYRHQCFAEAIQRILVESSNRIAESILQLLHMNGLSFREDLIFKPLRSPLTFFIGHANAAFSFAYHSASDSHWNHSAGIRGSHFVAHFLFITQKYDWMKREGPSARNLTSRFFCCVFFSLVHRNETSVSNDFSVSNCQNSPKHRRRVRTDSHVQREVPSQLC